MMWCLQKLDLGTSPEYNTEKMFGLISLFKSIFIFLGCLMAYQPSWVIQGQSYLCRRMVGILTKVTDPPKSFVKMEYNEW